ncbi:hypothetical protein RRG08_056129 [Elysia crispata]|uniref:Uncharacterized protein n=1 Tax=Elysia crispata TaxID=231223 RepID=A0AAE0YVA0_9GAST|nr:hypothetical protein RRG08_056129 [Elysia crispata]
MLYQSEPKCVNMTRNHEQLRPAAAECNVVSIGAHAMLYQSEPKCVNMTRNHEQLRPAAAECNVVSIGALVCQPDQEP